MDLQTDPMVFFGELEKPHWQKPVCVAVSLFSESVGCSACGSPIMTNAKTSGKSSEKMSESEQSETPPSYNRHGFCNDDPAEVFLTPDPPKKS